MSVEIDVHNFIPVLEKCQNYGDFIDCFVQDNKFNFVHIRQYDLIEFTICFSNESFIKPSSIEIKISDWLSALKLCKRATITLSDLTLIARCSWGQIKVFNKKTDLKFDTIIESGSDKFGIPIEAFQSIVSHFKLSKLIYMRATKQSLIFTDEDQKNSITVPTDLSLDVPEVAYDCNLISNCLLPSVSPCVFLSFKKDAPLHIEFDYFFQNKLRFVIAPIIEE
jgi:hypothetical protein